MSLDTKECPFCAETIKAKAVYCRFCQHYLDGREYTSPQRNKISGDKVEGSKTTVGDVDSFATAIGNEAKAEVKLGKEVRDEQYEIALNWEAHGKPRMRGFDLSGRDLSRLNLAYADLQKANLEGIDLRGANLQGAILYEANLARAKLCWANLNKANLSRANLNKAFLSVAKLVKAELFGADLGEARLLRTDLRNAFLDGANLQSVIYSSNTKWPLTISPESVGAILVADFIWAQYCQ